MNPSTELALTNKEKAQEWLIALAKGGLSFVPGGGLVTEVCGVLIPDKQDERIMKMLIQVYEKVEDMDKSKVQERLKEPDFQELFHDCKYEAARTSAQIKLKGIANLLVSGIKNDTKVSQLGLFLSTMSRLNELDLLILVSSYANHSHRVLTHNTCCVITSDYIGVEYLPDTVHLIESYSKPSLNRLINEHLYETVSSDFEVRSPSFQQYTISTFGRNLVAYMIES